LVSFSILIYPRYYELIEYKILVMINQYTMKNIWLLGLLLASSQILNAQNFDFLKQNKQIKAYSVPAGTVKLISDNAIDTKIKLQSMANETNIMLILHTYDNGKHIQKEIALLDFLDKDSPTFSIIADPTDQGVKIFASTLRYMSRLKIKEDNRFKFVLTNPEACKENIPLITLYEDNNGLVEKLLKEKKVVDDHYKTSRPQSLSELLNNFYTITYEIKKK